MTESRRRGDGGARPLARRSDICRARYRGTCDFCRLPAAGGALLSGTPRAEAHAALLATSPVDGSVLGAQPQQVTLRFNEAVTVIPQSIQLLDAAGHSVLIGKPRHLAGSADAAAADLPSGMHEGTYVVSWRVVSTDSHVVSGA